MLSRTSVSIAGLLTLAGCAAPMAKPSSPALPAPLHIDAPEVRITQEPLHADFALEGAVMQGGATIGTTPVGATSVTLNGSAVPIDPEGRFLIAFDRDAAPTATLRAVAADGRSVTKVLNVAPRAWRIERIDAPLRPTRDTEAFLAVRAPELAQIAAARAIHSDSRGWRQRFQWPILGRVSGLFGAQRIYRGQPAAYHGDVDVAATAGTEVRAPADGVVVLAADHPFTLEGNLLIIDHGAGLNSAFLHLSRIDVREGDHVRQGQRIGAVGATGRATGPHLHWGMKWNEARVDPLLLVDPVP
ncbi:MAG: M23 family metallopeptidase [Sphingobium sp.]|uniref:M23 family metallopeptidase n=1 Tax=Sphingobium sp. TaxID=1912891 RepID=UPI0029BE6E2F|nr:M23 family metallopeptidase [Sphingobium sp.]MDX3909913.1 M23 family metallopeptidase [Sphingobium sp.]